METEFARRISAEHCVRVRSGKLFRELLTVVLYMQHQPNVTSPEGTAIFTVYKKY